MNITDFFAKNWKFIAGVIALAAVLTGGIAFWKEQGRARERQATNFLYEAQVKARELVAAKKVEEAEQALLPVVERFPKSRAAFEASLQMGDLWMENGALEKAVKRYEEAVALAADSFSKILARYNLGIAYEMAGKFKEAVESYDVALKAEGSSFLQPEILMAQARCYEALQEAAKAVGIYQQIQKDFANRSYYSGAAAAFEKQLSSGSSQ